MRFFITLCVLLLFGCTRITVPTQPSNNSINNINTSNNPVSSKVKIEMRVSGNASSVRVRTSNPNDGLTQTVTSLPYFISFDTTEDTLFVSLDVTPLSYSSSVQFPFMSAQIFVNGTLFREATSADWLFNTLSVNGTWRK
jgi:hypothetical protein